jgi:hypothetical protein
MPRTFLETLRMPGVDDLDQNVPFPLLSDPPNIESATSNLVDAVVPKLNMTFADANARAATIPAPTPGMECFLIAEKRKEIFDGTSWVTLTASGWTSLTFASGYIANTGSPGYRIVNQCVELRGTGRNSGNTAVPVNAEFVIATLPAIARPPQSRFFVVAAEWWTDIYARIEVRTNGDVVVIIPLDTGIAPGARWVCFDGIRFSLT